MVIIRAIVFFLALPTAALAEPALPPRPAAALSGTEVVARIRDLDRTAREDVIREQFEAGNVPNFWRTFARVRVNSSIGGRERTLEYFAAPDYLAIGSDEDFFLAPVSPECAQKIADKYAFVLPTPKMVDDIYAAADMKLEPAPIPPGPAMTTVPIFAQHNEAVRRQRAENRAAPGGLTSGHKKDVVISARISKLPGKVAIYGWHRSNGKPIQPLYHGHTSAWIDYSHGIRFVQRLAWLDEKPVKIETVLADTNLCALLSYEGPVEAPRYGPPFETFSETRLDDGIRVVMQAPGVLETNKPVRLVVYALPNGNSIEQTIGRPPRAGDDFRFDIQHIGAQTRWLRARMSDANLGIAYLECAEKSWPLWKRKYPGRSIPAIVQSVRQQIDSGNVRIVLSGHSGGGSFIFGFIDAVEKIPGEVERILFLDSNYNYDASKGHARKLADWLDESAQHALAVFAYHDSIALLDGKTFISEEGGTWGRSRAMLEDLRSRYSFASRTEGGMHFHRALNGRLQFFLKENPSKAVLHTAQVELNGFIHSLLAGTEFESKDYSYFGPRAYAPWIQD